MAMTIGVFGGCKVGRVHAWCWHPGSAGYVAGMVTKDLGVPQCSSIPVASAQLAMGPVCCPCALQREWVLDVCIRVLWGMWLAWSPKAFAVLSWGVFKLGLLP